MIGYIVYWPQDRVKEIQKAGDAGPVKVVLGSIHSRMPACRWSIGNLPSTTVFGNWALNTAH